MRVSTAYRIRNGRHFTVLVREQFSRLYSCSWLTDARRLQYLTVTRKQACKLRKHEILLRSSELCFYQHRQRLPRIKFFPFPFHTFTIADTYFLLSFILSISLVSEQICFLFNHLFLFSSHSPYSPSLWIPFLLFSPFIIFFFFFHLILADSFCATVARTAFVLRPSC